MALTKPQRDQLEEAALRAFAGTLSPLVHGFRIMSPRGQLVAIYWSDNEAGNDVEIAVCDNRLTEKYPLQDVQAWLAQEQTKSGRRCNLHKGDSDWPIVGFKFDDAFPFLTKCMRFRRGFLRAEELDHLRQARAAQTPEDAKAAALRAELAALRPTQRHAVIDLVARAGISTAPWHVKSDGTPAVAPRSNPSYCYEWSFGGADQPVLLCIWHGSLVIDAERIRLRGNLRSLGARLQEVCDASGEQPEHRNRARDQARRARRFDELVSSAAARRSPIRVILNEGQMRSEENLGKESSVVRVRRLDEVAWDVTWYEESSGQFELVRRLSGSSVLTDERPDQIREEFDAPVADQFDVGSDDPSTKTRVGSVIERDPAVRRAVLARSGGRCEFCDAPGFRMSDGRLYLETHHVQPLAEGGVDRVWNVAALCANDHREAHFGERATKIRQELLEMLADWRSTP